METDSPSEIIRTPRAADESRQTTFDFEAVELKTCGNCETPKERSKFYKHNRTRDGLQTQCKACQSEYRKNNSEKIAKYQSEYRKNNSEKIAEYRAEYHVVYYKNNREKINEYNAEYYKNNREKIAKQRVEYNAEYNKNNREKFAVRDAEKHAKAQRAKYGDDWEPYQSYGFKPQEPAVLYVVKVRNKNTMAESLKAGITNRSIEERFRAGAVRYELLEIYFEFPATGSECQELERAFLNAASNLGMRAQGVAGRELEQLKEGVGLRDVLRLLNTIPSRITQSSPATA